MEDSSARDRRSRRQVSAGSVSPVCGAAVNGCLLRRELVLASELTARRRTARAANQRRAARRVGQSEASLGLKAGAGAAVNGLVESVEQLSAGEEAGHGHSRFRFSHCRGPVRGSRSTGLRSSPCRPAPVSFPGQAAAEVT
ncbi:hypothetical protein INR49_009952 [Caranx melampygus]|nr:hypothetical protein INR49_011589 [Caranx melampygus]KAG7232044.1 hypothetical protein INR49_009952 [Caranx melampygus]